MENMISNKGYKILKYIYDEPKLLSDITEHFKLSEEKVYSIFYSDEFSKYFDYVENPSDVDPHDSLIKISFYGEGFIDGRKRDFFRIYLPVIIDSILSVAAIIISIIALI